MTILNRFARGRLAALGIVVALLLADSGRAQGGYTTEKRPDLGLTFPRARDYEEIPIPPSEEFVVLFFGRKNPDKNPAPNVVRSEMSIVWIEKVPDRGPNTGSTEPLPPPPESDPGSTTGPGEKKSEPKAKPINSVERWTEAALPGWRLSAAVDGKARGGYTAREYLLTRKGDERKGWVFAYEGPQRFVTVLGIAHKDVFEDQQKIWRYTAERLDIKEPEEKSSDKIKMFYARKPYKAIDYRIKVRMNIVRGWKAEDTENYIVVYNTPDQPLVRRLLRDLELLRKEYEKMFPPTKAVEAVSTVRVCKNRAEYMSYGGPEMSAGYWNWVDEELVFYDAEVVDKNHVSSDADTFIVLYHEAFHQYIHYSTGELPPHSWFNEGTGDYFSGAVIKDGKLQKIGPNPWRLETIQQAIALELSIPWRDMIKFEQAQYYKSDIVGICYAQGWSMIYFLRKSDLVEKRPEWKKILPTYFDTLKSDYAARLEQLATEGKLEDRAAKAKAGFDARTKALEAAFADVDIDELEDAWAKFTLAIEVPKGKR
ncbi:MAG: hypothetical protein JNL28_01425 [Planctomycetes bacterium]|nr:hypothetical protein [Planctomycetota bacterium]